MKLEFDQFRSELDVLKEKMKEVHLQQLELELTELEESFDKHEKVLDNLLTASESCCAVVQRFQDCVSGRFYCFQVCTVGCNSRKKWLWFVWWCSLYMSPSLCACIHTPVLYSME